MVVKRQLHEFQVRTANRLRQRQGRKLVIRVVSNASASATKLRDEDAEQTEAPASAMQPPLTPLKRRNKFSRWWLLWLSIIFGLGGTALAAFFLLATIPPQVNCKNMSPLAPEMDRLTCAQQAAQSGKLEQLVEAMKFVKSLSPDNPVYPEATRLMEDWSRSLLAIARQRIDQGDLKGAIAIARQIPSSSPLYPEVQAAMKQWQGDWRQGQEITKKFLATLKEQKWFEASLQIQALSRLDNRYWDQKQLDKLIDRMSQEKKAWQQLEEAQTFAEAKTPEGYAPAIALAGKVNPNTYVKSKAKAEINLWSQELLKITAEHFEKEEFDRAITAAQLIPPKTSVYKEAQDWIQLSRSYAVAQENKILSFLEAQAALRQISPKSPLRQQARVTEALWQSNLQDRLQMQFAETIASFDQPLAFEFAISQAQAIAPKRPGRIEAQTQIAHWRKQIQQIQDRIALARSKQLATPGTLESLRAAVEEGSRIKLGQPLRIEAQTYIAQWTKAIQTMEDRPILDLAKGLAQQGNLQAAVAAASKIAPGRALYSEAQASLSDWVTQIQIAEDTPILNEANALAANGRLTAAINKASRIRYGRALYREAQGAIARWASEREAILIERQKAAELQQSIEDSSSESQTNSEPEGNY
ncbi:hypothetical protein [Coleofasciculus sp. FACHB-SPT9]|uniref:hypothetical protein n=1 Tax=Cyanophyceae TaxID=3028117 RepID=UPI0016837181|nr:hypothetical protein [Coleofasciculus sp. FACHB-SPT9]MBD1892260.1 hypothetical protein [Coleofasciculus sp. FACHB-SPT9]